MSIFVYNNNKCYTLLCMLIQIMHTNIHLTKNQLTFLSYDKESFTVIFIGVKTRHNTSALYVTANCLHFYEWNYDNANIIIINVQIYLDQGRRCVLKVKSGVLVDILKPTSWVRIGFNCSWEWWCPWAICSNFSIRVKVWMYVIIVQNHEFLFIIVNKISIIFFLLWNNL